jgi:hypothetical protein
MKTQILIVSFAAIAAGAWIAGDYFGTPYLAPHTLCVADTGEHAGQCKSPISCTYAGVQGRRHIDEDGRTCPPIRFLSWDHNVPQPVVFREPTPEQVENARSRASSDPKELGPAPALTPADMPRGR